MEPWKTSPPVPDGEGTVGVVGIGWLLSLEVSQPAGRRQAELEKMLRPVPDSDGTMGVAK